MEIKTFALCVKAQDFRESDKLLTLVSTNLGKIDVLARGIRSAKAKLKPAAMPLCFGEYILARTASTFTLIGCSITDNFFNCWSDLHKYAASQIILELIGKITYTDSDIHSKIELVYAIKALSAINYSTTFPYLPSIWYILKILPQVGIDINDIKSIESLKPIIDVILESSPEETDSIDISLKAVIDILKALNIQLKNSDIGKTNSITEGLKLLSEIPI
ncbi:MAG: DNA repair protein RecO [Christensenellaceae bacterium]|jgi:DNA repair protein RecO|nr:DNA repair protein RecO [Christensenellaceae bacterium]